MKDLKIKICGMKDPGNIQRISLLLPDYMGFIFYPRSLRYAGELSPAKIAKVPARITKVGVFVNLPAVDVLSSCRQMGIRTVQLHGNESPDYCKKLKDNGLKIIKVFSIGIQDGFKTMSAYQDACDFYLLDTAFEEYGGSGKQFEWTRLNEYDQDKPFFLSGGIDPGDAERILELKHPELFGVDLNSRFETEPGIKTRDKLSVFMQKIRT